jgi:hypothetical protein
VTTEPPPTATAEFKLSITRALADQLAEALERLEPTSLTLDNLDTLQARPGVYELYLEDQRVYVGKADKNLPIRLRKHLRKLSGRAGIDPSDVGFLCLYVDEDLEAAAPEKLLIKKYRVHDSIPWNTNGFGNNDPGRNRDKSLVKRNHFDTFYPIDLEKKVAVTPGSYKLKSLLDVLKVELPYNFRFASKAKIFSQLTVEVQKETKTARDFLILAVQALPESWQATALPGYAILYEDTSDYDSAIASWRILDGKVREIPGRRHVSKEDVSTEEIDDESMDDA